MSFLIFYFFTEGQILHWAVGNGYTQFSKMLLQCGVYVDVPGLLKETPLHLAAKNGFRDLVDVLVQSGGNVNARNFPMQETPLHLATRNGHQHIAQFLIQQGSEVNARNVPSRETPLHLASRNNHQQIAEFLIHHGSQLNARNAPLQETPLHLASKNGHHQIAEFLIQHGGLVNARKRPWQETALHLASRNGHQQIAEFLIQHGGQVNARNIPWQETPLHLAAKNGHQQIAEVLLQHGAQVNGRNIRVQETPLHKDTRNHNQQISQSLGQQKGHANASNVPLQETSLHRAEKNGHQSIVEFLILKRSQNDARILPVREIPLKLVSQDGRQATQIAVPAKQIAVPLRYISGSFSSEFESVKKHHVEDKAVTARVQMHHVFYPAKLQPDSALQPGFKSRLLEIVCHQQHNNTAYANYLAQILVRDFGTYFITRVNAGVVPKVNHLIKKIVADFTEDKNRITAAASASFLGTFGGSHHGSLVHARQIETPFHWARKKNSPELSSLLCHWLKKKFSATSYFRQSARREIQRLRFSLGKVLWNCMNEVDLILKTQTKSQVFTESHHQIFLGGKDLVDQSLVQSHLSIRKEKLLTKAFGSFSDSESFSSSDRKTSQVLSWYATVLCVDGKYGKDGINCVHTSNFSVIIGCCIALCFVFVALGLWFFRRNKTTVRFPGHCSIRLMPGNITGSGFKCIPTIELIETNTAVQCVTETADNEPLGYKGCTQTILTKNSVFERTFFPEVLTFSYQQLHKDKSVRRLRMERVRKWLECNHDQDVLSSVESEGNACVEIRREG